LNIGSSVWKQRFAQKKLNWNDIPMRIYDNAENWVVLYAHLRHQILFKSYIKNPSGHGKNLKTYSFEWKI